VLALCIPCIVLTGNDADGYTMTAEFVEAMLEEFRQQRVVHRRFAFEIILKACAGIATGCAFAFVAAQ
jgi:hypothetical protein